MQILCHICVYVLMNMQGSICLKGSRAILRGFMAPAKSVVAAFAQSSKLSISPLLASVISESFVLLCML